MSISVVIRHSFGSFTLDATFQSDGKLLVLFGPSGCGKTTIINVIAGLLHADEASVTINGEVLADTARGFWPPPHRRHIGYVFQDARLFPHLNVRQNLAYGRWFTRASQRYADEDTVVTLLGLQGLLGRRPRQLSGGEKQRVALGRALLQSPRLLLMDEPLASLDEARKQDVLPYVERLRDQLRIPIIYVSHSPAEVARLATDVVLMADGHVVNTGSATDMLPAMAAMGEEFGREAGALLEMQVMGYDAETGLTALKSGAGVAQVSGHVAEPGAKVRVLVRPADVMIATEMPRAISALNVFAGRIEQISPAVGGVSADVTLKTGTVKLTARITGHSVRQLGLKPGVAAYAIVKAVSVRTPTRLPAERQV